MERRGRDGKIDSCGVGGREVEVEIGDLCRGRGDGVRKEGREWEREVVEEERLELLLLGMRAEPLWCEQGRGAEST